MKKSKILDSNSINQKINRLAWQIYENNLKEKEIIMVGVSGRGEILTYYISEVLNQISSIKIKLGTINLDKDNPYNSEITTNLKLVDYSNKVVILVDDVLNSGKTLIYACKYFLTTPLVRLSTVVLIERKHNLYPIKANYVGLSLATTLQQYITVSLERDNKGVYLS
tara:strand:- start:655 stop:1155 length:501 start_codon:yes stop_codon:yes gene_type:complete